MCVHVTSRDLLRGKTQACRTHFQGRLLLPSPRQFKWRSMRLCYVREWHQQARAPPQVLEFIISSSGIRCMSETEWDACKRKCSDTAVSLEMLGCTCLSTCLRCSLKRSLSCRLVSPMYKTLKQSYCVTMQGRYLSQRWQPMIGLLSFNIKL